MRTDDNFAHFWEGTVSPDTPEDLVAHWREYVFSDVERGHEIVRRCSRHFSPTGNKVLDIGSGFGGAAIAFAQSGAEVIGIDGNLQRLEGAWIRTNRDNPGTSARWLKAFGEDLPFGQHSFDLVLCNDVLEHVKSQRRVLKEIARVLKPGGWLYLQFPNFLSLANLRSDPHYNLFGASILPPLLGAFYVVRLRKRSPTYEVGHFPVASLVAYRLRRLGLETFQWWPSPARRLRFLTSALNLYRFNTVALLTLIARKSR